MCVFIFRVFFSRYQSGVEWKRTGTLVPLSKTTKETNFRWMKASVCWRFMLLACQLICYLISMNFILCLFAQIVIIRYQLRRIFTIQQLPNKGLVCTLKMSLARNRFKIALRNRLFDRLKQHKTADLYPNRRHQFRWNWAQYNIFTWQIFTQQHAQYSRI